MIILTHPNTKNLKYKEMKKFYLNKKKLKQVMLSEAANWNQESHSEVHLDFQYRSPTTSYKESYDQFLSSKRTTAAQKRKTISPFKIFPDKLSVTTAVFVRSENQVARETIIRRAKKTRGTLKSM